MARFTPVQGDTDRAFSGSFARHDEMVAKQTKRRLTHLMERPAGKHESRACTINFLANLAGRLPIDVKILEWEGLRGDNYDGRLSGNYDGR